MLFDAIDERMVDWTSVAQQYLIDRQKRIEIDFIFFLAENKTEKTYKKEKPQNRHYAKDIENHLPRLHVMQQLCRQKHAKNCSGWNSTVRKR